MDEGASISILSSMAWKAMGSPPLKPASNHILKFNRSASAPLGIIPQWPITLRGKTICIDDMVVQGPLDFNFLLGHDYMSSMKSMASSLF